MRAHATVAAVLSLIGSCDAVVDDSPTTGMPRGLLCDMQRGPALGVGTVEAPTFGWIVPPCPAVPNVVQLAYRVTVVSADSTVVWDSGKVSSNDSVTVRYQGTPLRPAATYTWTVQTWVGVLEHPGAECESAVSPPARFVTALLNGWDPLAKWIWPSVPVGSPPTRFAFFRRVLDLSAGPRCVGTATETRAHEPPATRQPDDAQHTIDSSPNHTVQSAVLYATASTDPTILSAIKVYIDGKAVAVGPGRGEAPVRGKCIPPSQFGSTTSECFHSVLTAAYCANICLPPPSISMPAPTPIHVDIGSPHACLRDQRSILAGVHDGGCDVHAPTSGSWEIGRARCRRAIPDE